MAHDVFISFKTEDKIIAEKIYDGLQTRSIVCWIFSKSIPFGKNFQSEIVRSIDTFKYAIATSQYLDVCHEIEHRIDEYLNQIYQAVSYHLPALESQVAQVSTAKASTTRQTKKP
jgi:hypothetical protein